VLTFMGDGAMLVFGLPAPKADDAWRAIEAARGLSHASRAWLAARQAESGRALGVRLGLHYGAVVLSRLGADTHQHITATGDTVNVASRLLEVAKQHGSTLAVSTDAIAAARDAGQDTAPLLSLGEIREVAIRGRARPLSVWLGHADLATE
jgi:adenylate cyclase